MSDGIFQSKYRNTRLVETNWSLSNSRASYDSLRCAPYVQLATVTCVKASIREGSYSDGRTGCSEARRVMTLQRMQRMQRKQRMPRCGWW